MFGKFLNRPLILSVSVALVRHWLLENHVWNNFFLSIGIVNFVFTIHGVIHHITLQSLLNAIKFIPLSLAIGFCPYKCFLSLGEKLVYVKSCSKCWKRRLKFLSILLVYIWRLFEKMVLIFVNKVENENFAIVIFHEIIQNLWNWQKLVNAKVSTFKVDKTCKQFHFFLNVRNLKIETML